MTSCVWITCVFLGASVQATPLLNALPEAFLGSWSGNLTKSVIGPRSAQLPSRGQDFLVISKPDSQGDVYMRQSDIRQMFRIQGGLMQYCAHEPGPFGATNPTVATAPFEVLSVDAQQVDFCWRGPRLPSHAANCTGCDCARWELRLNNGTLQSTFMMSPPAVHLQMNLVKTGDPPPAQTISKAWRCDIQNVSGNIPFSPGSRASMHASLPVTPSSRFGLDIPQPEVMAQGQVKTCLRLNQHHNVRLSYTIPKFPCMPCNVTFAFSMDTSSMSSAVSYVAIGFKDIAVSYANASILPFNMSNYWGMAGDNIGQLSGRIVVGYVGKTGAQCVRQMRTESYVSAPTDMVDDGRIQQGSVTTQNGHTTVEFTTPFAAGKTREDANWLLGSFGRNRLMWAMGGVDGDGGCAAPIQYHNEVRGNAPLDFPLYGQACLCSFPHTCISPWERAHSMLDSDLIMI